MVILVAGALGAVLALPIAAILAAGKRVPVALSVLPVALVPLAAAASVALGVGTEDLSGVPTPMLLVATSHSLAGTLLPLANTGLAAAPAAFLVLGGSAIAALRSDRKQAGPALAGAGLLAIGLAGVLRDFLLLPEAPLPLYGLGVLGLGLLAVVALAGADPDGNAPEAAGSAGVGFVLWVIAAAIGSTASLEGLLHQAIAGASSEMLGKLWASGEGVGLPVQVRGMATVLWASGLGLLGLGAAMSPVGARRIGNAAGLAWLAFGLLALRALDTSAWERSTAAVHAAHNPRPGDNYLLGTVGFGEPQPVRLTFQMRRDRLLIEGETVGLVSDGRIQQDQIDALKARLAVLRAQLEQGGAPVTGPLNIAADRRWTWGAVQGVVAAVDTSGFEGCSFHALSEDTGGLVGIPVRLEGSGTSTSTAWIEIVDGGWRLTGAGPQIQVRCTNASCDDGAAVLVQALESANLRGVQATVVPAPDTSLERLLATLDACGALRDGEARFGAVLVGSPSSLPPVAALEDAALAPAITIQGALTVAEVQGVVDRAGPKLQACYETGLKRNPTLAGDLRIKVLVGSTGSVTNATVATSTLGDAEVEACMTERFTRMRFPVPPGGGIAIVGIPLSFGNP